MAYISQDDGKTWKGGLEIDGRADVSYPDAAQDENGNIYIYATTFHATANAKYASRKLMKRIF